MVEITKGVGSVQGAQNQNTSKTQTSSGKAAEKNSQTSSVGEVELNISEEALSIAQAEATARNARAQLENSDQTLSKAGDLDELLA